MFRLDNPCHSLYHLVCVRGRHLRMAEFIGKGCGYNLFICDALQYSNFLWGKRKMTADNAELQETEARTIPNAQVSRAQMRRTAAELSGILRGASASSVPDRDHNHLTARLASQPSASRAPSTESRQRLSRLVESDMLKIEPKEYSSAMRKPTERIVEFDRDYVPKTVLTALNNPNVEGFIRSDPILAFQHNYVTEAFITQMTHAAAPVRAKRVSKAKERDAQSQKASPGWQQSTIEMVREAIREAADTVKDSAIVAFDLRAHAESLHSALMDRVNHDGRELHFTQHLDVDDELLIFKLRLARARDGRRPRVNIRGILSRASVRSAN